MKKIILPLLLILLAGIISALPLTGVLGWAISAKQGTWEVKAICAVSAGIACEGAKLAVNPEGYIEGKSLGFLSEASPELGQAISAATNPQGFITQKALTEMAKNNPEAAQGLGEALTTVEQLKSLGVDVNSANLKFDNSKGTVTEASFTTKEEGQIGNLVGKDIKKEEISVREVKFDKKDEMTTLTFTGDESYIKIRDNLFMNIQKQSTKTNAYIELNEKGDITEADFTTTEQGGTYIIGNDKIDVPSNSRLIFKEGKIELMIPDNGKLEKAPSLSKSGIEGNTIEIKGKNIVLPEGFVLQEGSLGYKDGQAYIQQGKVARVNGIKIDNSLSDESRVNVYFDGKDHKNDLEDYISFGNKEFFIYGDDKPDKLKIEFSEENPYLKFDDDDSFSISNSQNILINIKNRDKEGLIPSFSIQETSAKTNLNIQNGEMKFGFKDSVFEYNVWRGAKPGDKTTTPISITYHDVQGRSTLSYENKPHKAIVTNFNEAVAIPLSTEETLIDFYNSDLGVPIDYATGVVSERLDFNYLPQTAWFEENTVAFEPDEYDLKKIEEAISRNPGKLVIAGATNNAVVKQIAGALDQLPPNVRDSVRAIIVYPGDELSKAGKYTTSSTVAFTTPDRIVRFRSGQLETGIIHHEATHDLTYNLLQEDFQRMAQQRLFGDFDKDVFDSESFSGKWHSIAEPYYEVHKDLKGEYAEIWATGPPESLLAPRHGCVEPYGCLNYHEDISTYIGKVHADSIEPGFFNKLIDPANPDKLYIQKLSFLNEYGYLPNDWLKNKMEEAGYSKNCIRMVTGREGYKASCIQYSGGGVS